MSIVLQFIDIALQLYVFVIFARVIISWLRVNPYNPIVRAIYELTEPVLSPIRNLMPRGMMLDFSPMIVIVLIFVIRRILQSLVVSIV